jgi:aromatic-L-amino-acid/L-tryptophan decarboxylase
MSRPPRGWLPLEPDAAAMRELLDQAAVRVIAHIESLGEQPASHAGPDAPPVPLLDEPLPESGEALAPLLDLVVDELTPPSYNCPGPGFLAFIPGGGLFAAAVADLVADSINRYVTVWHAAPGLAQIEAQVLRWFSRMIGLPEGAGGYLASGGSLANFTALVAARRDRLPEDFLTGTIYCSDQVHHSVLKAAALAGFPDRNVRRVPSDEQFRLRLDLLAERIAEDRASGLAPFLIVACAGTTNTGAVDDLAALGEIARRERLWLHVDAAYGGFFALTERGRRRLAGIETADSVTLDPHKGLFLPYGTGCLLVRDAQTLLRAHRGRGAYMPPAGSDGRIDPCELSPELSREFRGLRVWLPLKLHGAAAFRRQLDEKLDLAAWAAEQLRELPEIEIVAAPQLSVVAFRLHPAGLDDSALDRLNHDLLERINARRRVFLTGTVLPQGFVLRICVLNFRTHREHLEAALADLREALESLRGRLAG